MASGTIPWTNNQTKQFGFTVAQNGGTRTIAVGDSSFGVFFTITSSQSRPNKVGCYVFATQTNGSVAVFPIMSASDITVDSSTAYRITVANANAGSISCFMLVFQGDMPYIPT